MNKKYGFIILGVIILVLGGLFMIRQYNLEKYYTEQKERIEIFFQYNYKDITSITFTGTGTTPMGSLDFEGYFNDDEEETFTATIMSHEENFEYHSVVDGSFNRKHFRKEELDGELVPVSEILKEQEGTSKEGH